MTVSSSAWLQLVDEERDLPCAGAGRRIGAEMPLPAFLPAETDGVVVVVRDLLVVADIVIAGNGAPAQAQRLVKASCCR